MEIVLSFKVSLIFSVHTVLMYCQNVLNDDKFILCPVSHFLVWCVWMCIDGFFDSEPDKMSALAALQPLLSI